MPTRLLSAALALAVLAGCDGGGKPKGDLPPLYPVTGKVIRNGQPVSGGTIRFLPDPDQTDLAMTVEVKPDGTFELQTIHALSQKRGTGAPSGSYRITYYPPLGDQTQGSNPAPVSPSKLYLIQDGPNDLTVDLDKT